MLVNTVTAGDIAITAAEGGTGYWGQIHEYQPSRWCNNEYRPQPVARDFVFYSMAEFDEDAGEYGDFNLDVTPEVIQRGVNLFLSGSERGQRGVAFKGRPFADMEDLSAMDADEADCVIQLGLFGELVYG